MNQLRITGSPDAFGELIKQHREIFFERRSRQLLFGVALNGFLHPAQFDQAGLETGDATFDLRPRLIRQRVAVGQK